MATREATGNGRKKLTTYGKTSRKSSKPVFSASTSLEHAQIVARPRTEATNRSDTEAVPSAVALGTDNVIGSVNRRKTAQDHSPATVPRSSISEELSGTPLNPASEHHPPSRISKVATSTTASRAPSRKTNPPARSGLVSRISSRTEQAKEVATNRRVRLIDRLAAQAPISVELDSERSSQLSDSLDVPYGQALTKSGSQATTPKKGHDEASRLRTQRPSPNSRKRKVKMTYGQQRTMRAAIDSMGDDKGDSNSSYPGDGDHNASPPAKSLKMDSFSLYDEPIEDDIPPIKNGILSLHALRQAGANHRFADELSDLADQIGVPISTQSTPMRARRRTALLELGGKLQDDKFVGRLCDYGSKETFFQDVGSEEDIINGFVLLSTVLVLVSSSSAPHLIEQLEANGVVQVLSMMLSLNDDIMEIARQKTANVSKRGLSLLGSLRAAILQLDVWDGPAPATLSPKTLALKVLCVCHKSSTAEIRRDLIEPVVPQLFAVVRQIDIPPSVATGDTCAQVNMALLLLQEHSIVAMQSSASSRWTAEYLPSIASLLSDTLLSSSEDSKETRYLTLRLAMNTTNNNPASASVFGQAHLVRKLATASLVRFEELHASAKRGQFPTDLHRSLVLLLGLLINISEHCPSTRQSLADEVDHEKSPLDGLIAVWLENRESCGNAETVEQSSLAVAYGYLAILLGYLCLSPTVRQRLAAQSNHKGLPPLLDSISEFMFLHARAAGDDLAATLQPLINELRLVMKVS